MRRGASPRPVRVPFGGSTELILTRREAALRASVPLPTIRLWIRAGFLHPLGAPHLGGRTQPVIDASELDRVLVWRRRRRAQTWRLVWGPKPRS